MCGRNNKIKMTLSEYLKEGWQELWEKYCRQGDEVNPTDVMYYEKFAEAITHHNHTLLTLLGEETLPIKIEGPNLLPNYDVGYNDAVHNFKQLINNLITQDENNN